MLAPKSLQKKKNYGLGHRIRKSRIERKHNSVGASSIICLVLWYFLRSEVDLSLTKDFRLTNDLFVETSFSHHCEQNFCSNTCPFQIRTVVGSYTSFSKITNRWGGGGGGAVHKLEERSAWLLTCQPPWNVPAVAYRGTQTSNEHVQPQETPESSIDSHQDIQEHIQRQHLFLQLHAPPPCLTFTLKRERDVFPLLFGGGVAGGWQGKEWRHTPSCYTRNSCCCFSFLQYLGSRRQHPTLYLVLKLQLSIKLLDSNPAALVGIRMD